MSAQEKLHIRSERNKPSVARASHDMLLTQHIGLFYLKTWLLVKIARTSPYIYKKYWTL